jgi:thiosulfate/3-mercaptopyruvate sulfurtransferase
MSYTTLVDASTLHEHSGDPAWVVVDCRFNLLQPDAGKQAYQAGHLPGARYAHLDHDLASPITAVSGRHPLPDPEEFARCLGAWGIDENTQVIAYDDVGGAIAARLWWMMRWMGHNAAAVLDGGLAAWQEAGYALEQTEPSVDPKQFPATPDREHYLGTDQVQQANAVRELLLIDARTAERYRGEAEPIDPVAGRIPNAINMPLANNLDGSGCFLEPRALHARFAQLLRAYDMEHIVHYCGSGVNACHNILAMEIAGLGGSKLYPGSWSEWIRDPQREIATD